MMGARGRGNRSRWIAIAAAVAGGAVVLAVAAGLVLRAGDDGLRILFTGEAASELEVCVCEGQMIGGLGNRGGSLATERGEYLLLDTGCMGCGTGGDDLLRLEALLRGMAVMKYDAANVGEYELWLGKERLKRFSGLGVSFVSANVTDRGGELVCPPFIVIEKSGVAVAVTGVVDSGAGRLGPGLAVDDPFQAVARIVPRMREESDLIVVLADLREDRARQLVGRFPEVSVVLFRGRGDTLAPELHNRSVIASVSGLGRFIGEVRLAVGDEGISAFSGTTIRVGKESGADPRVEEASMEWYRKTEKAGRRSGSFRGSARPNERGGASRAGAGK